MTADDARRSRSALEAILRWEVAAITAVPGGVPPMRHPDTGEYPTPPPGHLLVSAEWLAFMLSFAFCEGALDHDHPDLERLRGDTG